MSKRPRHAGDFKPGDPRTLEAARKGGAVTAAQRRAERGPYTGSILDVMDAAGLVGPSWEPWRTFWRAVFALPMSEADRERFRTHTDREEPPAAPVREAWMPVGRRGGKSRNAAVAGLFLAIRFDPSNLAPGELAVVPVLAADRDQARAVFGYLKGLCELPEFKPYVHRVLRDRIELHVGVNLEISTASYKTIRGRTAVGIVCDEVAFWSVEGANPDSEVLAALRPAMATVPDALLLGLSSPYAAKGELYRAYERSWGKPDDHVLVWNADTRSMNPEVPVRDLERAFEDDPVAAASEYGEGGRVRFRTDVESFLDPEAVREVTPEGTRELPPGRGIKYFGFVDPSGGSQDSMTLAVAHLEQGRAVLDLIREVRPPFSPDGVVQEFAAVLRSYGLSRVTGDRYGGQWPQERFQRHGVTYEASPKTKSDIYRELLPLVNAGTCTLLDLPVLRAQLVGLERRVARGGKDSVDHPPGGRDDVANAAAGALVMAAPNVPGKRLIFPGAPQPDGSRAPDWESDRLRRRLEDRMPTGPATWITIPR